MSDFRPEVVPKIGSTRIEENSTNLAGVIERRASSLPPIKITQISSLQHAEIGRRHDDWNRETLGSKVEQIRQEFESRIRRESQRDATRFSSKTDDKTTNNETSSVSNEINTQNRISRLLRLDGAASTSLTTKEAEILETTAFNSSMSVKTHAQSPSKRIEKLDVSLEEDDMTEKAYRLVKQGLSPGQEPTLGELQISRHEFRQWVTGGLSRSLPTLSSTAAESTTNSFQESLQNQKARQKMIDEEIRRVRDGPLGTRSKISGCPMREEPRKK